jgi:hypothetical protein
LFCILAVLNPGFARNLKPSNAHSPGPSPNGDWYITTNATDTNVLDETKFFTT